MWGPWLKSSITKGNGMALKVGTPAPDFSLSNQKNETFRLSEHLGEKALLLAFYPGDFTPVCTKEMVCFKQDFSEFDNLDCQIFGISCDSVEKHAQFVQEYSFPFDLLADPKAQVTQLYDVKMPFVNKANRAIFIIDKAGIIVYAHAEKLPVFKRSNQELLEALKQLK